MDNCYIITIENEDYTIGKMLEFYLYNKYFVEKKSESFDVIIDDGSHNYTDILNNFQNFFKRIKPGGFYIIEDFNHYCLHSSYFNDKPDNAFDISEIFEFLLNKKKFKY